MVYFLKKLQGYGELIMSVNYNVVCVFSLQLSTDVYFMKHLMYIFGFYLFFIF